MEEPSVLDYLKSILMPWKGQRIHLPDVEADQVDEDSAVSEETTLTEEKAASQESVPAQTGEDIPLEENVEKVVISTPAAVIRQPSAARAQYHWPWLSILALLLGLLAQTGFDNPSSRSSILGIALYGLAAAAFIGAFIQKEWHIPDLPEDEAGPMPTNYRWLVLMVGGLVVVVAFFLFSNNRFTAVNLLLGLAALGYAIFGVYHSSRQLSFTSFWQNTSQSVLKFLRARPAQTWGVVLVVVLLTGLALFFRFYRLSSVPGEMFSDHAEKLLDVSDILNGKPSIFFPRNTGREAIQFYLTAAIATWLNMGLTYISLKLGTALIGFFNPAIYLFAGKGNWRETCGAFRREPGCDSLLAKRHRQGRIAVSAISPIRGPGLILFHPRTAPPEPE